MTMNLFTKKSTYVFVVWSTSSLTRPRVKILLDGLKEKNHKIIYCQKTIWDDFESKYKIKGTKSIVKLLAEHLRAYLSMSIKYLSLPNHDFVLVPYMGQFDLLFLKPLALIRKKTIVWDFYTSLHETLVNDRKLINKNSIYSILLFLLEWIGTRFASILFIDTRSHAELIRNKFHLRKEVYWVPVGSEKNFAATNKKRAKKDFLEVLFYGRLSPLHGVEIIVKAAKILEKNKNKFNFILIGEGQDSKKIDEKIISYNLKSIKRYSFVPYEHLPYWISRADICLGIFSSNDKAQRVVPNKLYQCLAMDKIIVTASSEALRDLISNMPNNKIFLIDPGNEVQLAQTLNFIKKNFNTLLSQNNNNLKISSAEVAGLFEQIIYKNIGI